MRNIISTCGFIVIHGDVIQLLIIVPSDSAGEVDAMFITDHLPELSEKNDETLTAQVPVNYAPASTT